MLTVLWSSDRALRVEEVRAALGRELAYNTVATILGRLVDKEVVQRVPTGRAFAYAPLVDEAGLRARRMAALLEGEGDRSGVLHRFVAALDADDLAELRRALDAEGGGT